MIATFDTTAEFKYLNELFLSTAQMKEQNETRLYDKGWAIVLGNFGERKGYRMTLQTF